jgi:farnesyl diphosphate synthase
MKPRSRNATAPLAPRAPAAGPDERRRAVDEALRDALADDRFIALDLAAAMRHAVFPGGQRWRPLATLAAAELAGAAWEDALPAAAAVELVHCSSLVFDDLPAMDDARTRRGAPAVHVRYGGGTAILAGLGLLTTAFGLVARAPKPRRAVALASHYLGPVGLLTGQVLDLASPLPAAEPRLRAEESAREVRLRKTSALVQLALRLGALHGGVTREQDRALSRFGREIGHAYQCVDDLKDAEEDAGHPASARLPRWMHLRRAEQCLRRGADALRAAFPDSPARRQMLAFSGQLGGALLAACGEPPARTAAP